MSCHAPFSSAQRGSQGSCSQSHLHFLCSFALVSVCFHCVLQGVVPCLGWGFLHDQTMLFMALKESGPSLMHCCLSPEWTAGMKAALQAVHSAGVLHGDLHPGNFVGGHPSDDKLIDFGCASVGSSQRLHQQEEDRSFPSMPQVGLLKKTLKAFRPRL